MSVLRREILDVGAYLHFYVFILFIIRRMYLVLLYSNFLTMYKRAKTGSGSDPTGSSLLRN